MKRFVQKIVMAVFALALSAGISLPCVSAQQYVDVGLPNFKITMNDIVIDNNERLYPIIVYRDITYVPMTYNDSRFLGLETKWSNDSGLQVNKISTQAAYKPNKGASNSSLESATLAEFRIRVNGKDIDNKSETYPLLVFRGVTYFPLTWRYMVDEFGWSSSFDPYNGLIINAKGSKASSTPVPSTGDKVFSQDFSGVTVIFDRSANNKPGNLYVTENNITKKIGNPKYIYGVGYLQAGTYGEYTAVDKVEYANRWVYTLAVNPAVSPIAAQNVRINIDTNEVQALDGSTISSDTGQVSDTIFSQDFSDVTVIFDRSANNKPGNLYVKENNVTRKVGNPKYIYGVGYLRAGTYGEYTPVDKVEYANRWIYTLAVDPSVSPITSKNVKINIDTNKVQIVDSAAVDAATPSKNVYSQVFGGITVIIDRASDSEPGNLYVKENNITRRIGNPNFIYGVAYIKLGPFETYNPVNKISVSGRWVSILAIDPSVSPTASKNVKVNIDTNEVQ